MNLNALLNRRNITLSAITTIDKINYVLNYTYVIYDINTVEYAKSYSEIVESHDKLLLLIPHFEINNTDMLFFYAQDMFENFIKRCLLTQYFLHGEVSTKIMSTKKNMTLKFIVNKTDVLRFTLSVKELL